MPHEVLVRTVLVQLVLLPQGLVHGQLVLLPLVVAAAVGVTTALAAGLTMTLMMMMRRKRSYVEGDGPGLAGSRKQHWLVGGWQEADMVRSGCCGSWYELIGSWDGRLGSWED